MIRDILVRHAAFWRDMSGTWFEGAQIHRLDNDDHYNRQNCRWLTQHEHTQESGRTRRASLAQEASRLSAQSHILTPRQAGATYQVHHDTIIELAKRGKFRAYKLGRLWRVDRESLERYIESTSTQPAQNNG